MTVNSEHHARRSMLHHGQARLATRYALRLHLSERRLLLVFGDAVALYAALMATLVARNHFTLTLEWSWVRAFWYALLCAIWFVVGALLNAYDLDRSRGVIHSLYAPAGAAVVTGLVYLFIPFITPPLPESRGLAALLPLLIVVGIVLWRASYEIVLCQPNFSRRALVVGGGGQAQFLARALSTLGRAGSTAAAGYHLLGAVDETRGEESGAILPILGSYADLPALIEESRPDDIIIAVDKWQDTAGELLPVILEAQERGVRVTTMTMLYEQLTGRLALEHLGSRFDIVLPLRWSASHRVYLTARRIVELLICLPGCLLVVAAVPMIWLANRFLSPGPLFLRQERVGRGGRPFNVYKFRSMIVDAEKYTGAVWATKNDPRITPVGRLLRKTRIDELPQFWNVLCGDMSIIGPRPERPPFVAQLSRDIPFYRVRHSVRPGLTGWAQVKYRYASSVDDSLIKLQYDLFYIKHQTPMLDLLILLRTAQIVLGFKGQ